MRRWPIDRYLLLLPAVAAVLAAAGAVALAFAPPGARALAWSWLLVAGVGCGVSLGIARATTARLLLLERWLAHAFADTEAPLAHGTGADLLSRLTERVQAGMQRVRARALHQQRSAEFLEFAQIAGGFGVFDLDLVTAQVMATPLFFDLAGLPSRQAIVARDHWLATVHPEDYESLVATLNDAITGDGRLEREYRTLRTDGSSRWLLMRGRVLKDLEGLPARAIGTVTDVTERHRLEEHLRYARESLDMAQRIANVATFDVQLERGAVITSGNFHALLGVSPHTPPTDLAAHLERIHPEDRPAVRACLSGDADAVAAVEFRVLHEERTEWLELCVRTTRDRAGQPVRLTGAIQLITHYKRAAEATREAMQAAESANRAKSQFLANLSHEIRTPMNGVIGMAQVLAETTLSAEQREYAEIIRSSAQALLVLLNDVLDLSKIEADHLELEHIEFNLRDVLYETASALALQATVKGLEIVADVDPRLPFTLHGDPGRIRQILINLLGNAIKFTHEGYIVLEVRVTSVDASRHTLTLAVRDTGIGIPEDRLDRLFQAFTQVDASTTRQYGGTGLGLAIVKRLAELMGGEAGVTSLPGVGSTFWVTLQLESSTVQPQIPALGADRRVLLVDDNAASLAALASKLTVFGFTVRPAASVEEALAVLATDTAFDVVVVDELMPVRGGLDLLAHLRSVPQLKRVPCILMSLLGLEESPLALEHRPDAVARKPLRGATLSRLIDRLLSGGATPAATARRTEPSGEPIPAGARVLLVEDHPVNQRVAERLLRKLGASVRIAHHGAEALERLAEAPADLVLMDCQMPVMDGFTATRLIRERELAQGLPRVPIVALTANVMREDRERCLAAGMDGHLGKPIEPHQLAECLRRFHRPAADPLVDVAALRDLVGDDADFERELIDTFIASGDRCLADIVTALDAQDLETIGKRAHALKGASANIHAHGLVAAASQVESAARGGSVRRLDELVRALGRMLQAVNAELRRAG